MPLIGPMLLLIFENVSAYALIQDYALIRTLRVHVRTFSKAIINVAFFDTIAADSDADIDAADDPSYFDLCHPGLPCFKVSPDVFKAILEEQGINSVDEEEGNDANDEDFDVGKRGSGSYLFRSRRGFNESPRLVFHVIF